MQTLEIILISAFSAVVLYIIYAIFFSKKKKTKESKIQKKKQKGKKETLGEKKIEPVVAKKEAKQEEKKEEEIKVVGPEEEKKKAGFKIIRKQSQIKIHKKALNTNSRNPSVSKVFKDGKMIEEKREETINVEPIDDVKKDINDLNDGVVSDIPSQNIGAYGVREPRYNEVCSDHEYKIIAPEGSPNRAPIIGDRTNFASHLTVTEDGNLSGVVGTGVAKIIDKAESQADAINAKTDNMIRNVKKDILGDMSKYDDMFNLLRGVPSAEAAPSKPTAKQKLKNIDARTLIIAEALNNPKSKKKNN